MYGMRSGSVFATLSSMLHSSLDIIGLFCGQTCENIMNFPYIITCREILL